MTSGATGDTVVLVHGSGVRDWTWSDQLGLADRYRLVMPYRRGYGDSPPADPDFEVDASDIADLLEGRPTWSASRTEALVRCWRPRGGRSSSGR